MGNKTLLILNIFIFNMQLRGLIVHYDLGFRTERAEDVVLCVGCHKKSLYTPLELWIRSNQTIAGFPNDKNFLY